MIKNKIKNLSLSTTLKINEISKNLEKEGKKIIKFGFGESPFQVPDKIVEELKNATTSERSGRAQDQENTYAMQKLRARGYM